MLLGKFGKRIKLYVGENSIQAFLYSLEVCLQGRMRAAFFACCSNYEKSVGKLEKGLKSTCENSEIEG